MLAHILGKVSTFRIVLLSVCSRTCLPFLLKSVYIWQIQSKNNLAPICQTQMTPLLTFSIRYISADRDQLKLGMVSNIQLQVSLLESKAWKCKCPYSTLHILCTQMLTDLLSISCWQKPLSHTKPLLYTFRHFINWGRTIAHLFLLFETFVQWFSVLKRNVHFSSPPYLIKS